MANGDFRGQDIGGMLKTPGSRYQAPTVRASTMTSGYEELGQSYERVNKLMSDMGGLFAQVADDAIEEERNNNYLKAVTEIDSVFSSLEFGQNEAIKKGYSQGSDPFSLVKDPETQLSPRHKYFFDKEEGVLQNKIKYIKRNGEEATRSIDDILKDYDHDPKLKNILTNHVRKKEKGYITSFESKLATWQKNRGEGNLKFMRNDSIGRMVTKLNLRIGNEPFSDKKLTQENLKTLIKETGGERYISEKITFDARHGVSPEITIADIKSLYRGIAEQIFWADSKNLRHEEGGSALIWRRISEGYYNVEMPKYVYGDDNKLSETGDKVEVGLDLSKLNQYLDGLQGSIKSDEKFKADNIFLPYTTSVETDQEFNTKQYSKYITQDTDGKYIYNSDQFFTDNPKLDKTEVNLKKFNVYAGKIVKAKKSFEEADKSGLPKVKTREDAERLAWTYLVAKNSNSESPTYPQQTHDLGKYASHFDKIITENQDLMSELIIEEDNLHITPISILQENLDKLKNVRTKGTESGYENKALDQILQLYKEEILKRAQPFELMAQANLLQKADLITKVTDEDYQNLDAIHKARGGIGKAPIDPEFADLFLNKWMPKQGNYRVSSYDKIIGMLQNAKTKFGSRYEQAQQVIRKSLDDSGNERYASLIFDFMTSKTKPSTETSKKLIDYYNIPPTDRNKEIKLWGKEGTPSIKNNALSMRAPANGLDGPLRLKLYGLYQDLANALGQDINKHPSELIHKAIRQVHGDNMVWVGGSKGNTLWSYKEPWLVYNNNEDEMKNSMFHMNEHAPYEILNTKKLSNWMIHDLNIPKEQAHIYAESLLHKKVQNLKMIMVPTNALGTKYAPAIMRIEPEHVNGGKIVRRFLEEEINFAREADPNEWLYAHGGREYVQRWSGSSLQDLKDELIRQTTGKRGQEIEERAGLTYTGLKGLLIPTVLQELAGTGRREKAVLKHLIDVAETKFGGDAQKANDYLTERWKTTIQESIDKVQSKQVTEFIYKDDKFEEVPVPPPPIGL